MEAVGVKLEGDRIVGARLPHWKLLVSGGGRKTLYRLNGTKSPNERRNHLRRQPEIGRALHEYIDAVTASEIAAESGMTSEEEANVEQHLRDLGYL